MMSEVFQSGRHPDADQLSAFVEQVLPAHEREATLAHLAVCPECRAVVALSLPAVQAPAVAEKPALRMWFQGWHLAWPAAAAVAALVLVLVFVHHAAIQPNGQVRQEEMAVARPPVPVAPLQAPQKQASAAANRDLKQVPAMRKRHAAQGNAETANALPQLPPAPSAPGMQAAAGEMGAGSGSLMKKDLLQQPSAKVASGGPQAPPVMAQEQPRALAPAAASTNEHAARPRTGATHGAFGAYGTAFTEKEASNREMLKAASPLQSLPSGLPAVSIAEHGRQVLALDSAHALFLSEDAGAHWRAIAVPWQARAVAVSLVPSLVRSAAQSGLGFGMGYGHGPGVHPSVSKPEPAERNASITGTVTDLSGAAISGAAVVVSRAGEHVTQTINTDKNGRYFVAGLAPGTYEVEARAPGFEIAHNSGVAVLPSRQSVANLKLSVASASETVSVAADSMAGKIPLQTRDQAVAPAPTAAAAAVVAPAIFAITTEDGARWTSADGVNWKRE